MAAHRLPANTPAAGSGSTAPGGIGSWAGILLLFALLCGGPGCGFFVKTRGETVPTRTLAPDFSLEDQHGQPVRLAALLEQGPVVIVFYRGHW